MTGRPERHRGARVPARPAAPGRAVPGRRPQRTLGHPGLQPELRRAVQPGIGPGPQPERGPAVLHRPGSARAVAGLGGRRPPRRPPVPRGNGPARQRTGLDRTAEPAAPHISGLQPVVGAGRSRRRGRPGQRAGTVRAPGRRAVAAGPFPAVGRAGGRGSRRRWLHPRRRGDRGQAPPAGAVHRCRPGQEPPLLLGPHRPASGAPPGGPAGAAGSLPRVPVPGVQPPDTRAGRSRALISGPGGN